MAREGIFGVGLVYRIKAIGIRALCYAAMAVGNAIGLRVEKGKSFTAEEEINGGGGGEGILSILSMKKGKEENT